MDCRTNCGACCIIPSISSAIPGMPRGKRAGERCIHLLNDYSCAIYNDKVKPKVCDDFKADIEVCGNTREDALILLQKLVDFCG